MQTTATIRALEGAVLAEDTSDPEDVHPAIRAAQHDVDRALDAYWEYGSLPEGLAKARALQDRVQALIAAHEAADGL